MFIHANESLKMGEGGCKGRGEKSNCQGLYDIEGRSLE